MAFAVGTCVDERSTPWPPGDSGNVSSGVIQYNVDGVPTPVGIDTVTPSNSTPLPVINVGPDGVPVDPSTATKQDEQSALLEALTGGFTLPFNQLTIAAKTINGPTVIETRLATVLQQTMTLTYDIDGDFQDYVVT